MRRLTALLAVCALSVSIAACGGGDNGGGSGTKQAAGAPSVKQLLAESASALDGAKSAHFDLSVKGTGSSPDPTFQKLLSKPLALDVNGDAAKNAVSIEGTALAAGKSFALGVRSDKRHSYIKFGDNWYGPSKGLESGNGNANDLPKLVAFLQQHGGELLTGKTVQDGPSVGGDDTWQVSGHPDADGIVAARKSQGKPLTADQQSGLRAIAPLVNVTYAAGKDDHLPRQMEVRLKINKAQADALQKLSNGSSSSIKVDALDLSMHIELTNWNKPVSIQKPSGVQPMKALSGALFGALSEALQS